MVAVMQRTCTLRLNVMACLTEFARIRPSCFKCSTARTALLALRNLCRLGVRETFAGSSSACRGLGVVSSSRLWPSSA